MKPRHALLTATMCLALLALTACVPQEKPTNWRVVSSESTIYLVTTKKLHVAEVMRLTDLSGHYDGQHFTLEINLESIDSGIPVRDERMQKHLFETGQQPLAVLTAELPATTLQSGKHKVLFTLSIHGKEQEYPAEIWVSELSRDRRLVSLVRPVLVRAEDFDLDNGIDILASIAKLANISHTVPVTAEIVLQAEAEKPAH